MRKINQYKRTYYKEIAAGLTVVAAVFIYAFPLYVVPEVKLEAKKAKIAYAKAPTIEDKIKQYFPKHHKEVLAIAQAESHLKTEAKGYNCYYKGKIVYTSRVKGSHSAACKPEHRAFAYSVDCGVLQVNIKGQVCPNESLDQHLAKAAQLSKVQGLNAWVTYNNGNYKKYLASK